jgi:hypothetical protein
MIALPAKETTTALRSLTNSAMSLHSEDHEQHHQKHTNEINRSDAWVVGSEIVHPQEYPLRV